MYCLKIGLAALTVSMGVLLTCNAQQPERRKGPPPRWNPVHLFPPDVRESLNLTADQEKQIDELEKDVRERVGKLLTAEQRKILSQARPRGPGRGGPDGPGGPDSAGGPPVGQGRRSDRDRPRPDGPDA